MSDKEKLETRLVKHERSEVEHVRSRPGYLMEVAVPDNPLEPPDEAATQRQRERARHLWEIDGRPDGHSDDYWERAGELIAMENSAGAGLLPNPASLPGADPSHPDIIEEASIQENLGESPGRLTDQGDRQQTPMRRKPDTDMS